MFRRKWPWVVAILVVAGVAGGAYARSKQEKGTLVTGETVQRRDLEALVSASGKIEPKRSVNISAQTMGRVTSIGVREGELRTLIEQRRLITPSRGEFDALTPTPLPASSHCGAR